MDRKAGRNYHRDGQPHQEASQGAGVHHTKWEHVNGCGIFGCLYTDITNPVFF
jgi:hypothetical protein